MRSCRYKARVKLNLTRGRLYGHVTLAKFKGAFIMRTITEISVGSKMERSVLVCSVQNIREICRSVLTDRFISLLLFSRFRPLPYDWFNRKVVFHFPRWSLTGRSGVMDLINIMEPYRYRPPGKNQARISMFPSTSSWENKTTRFP